MNILKQKNYFGHNFKAFTLIELVVAMIISSIVILAAFESYTITTVQFADYKKKSNLIGQSYQLNMVLNKDCFDASVVCLSEDSNLIFKFDGNPDIIYAFKNAYILRQVNQTLNDTFYFANSDLQAKFESKPWQIGSYIIDEFSFKMKVLGENVTVALRKEYGADVLMNETNTHIKVN